MKSLLNTVAGGALVVAGATAVSAGSHATELTIAIVNNGHMINMQKVAEAYTEETGVKLNWVSLALAWGEESSLPAFSHRASLWPLRLTCRHPLRRLNRQAPPFFSSSGSTALAALAFGLCSWRQ